MNRWSTTPNWVLSILGVTAIFLAGRSVGSGGAAFVAALFFVLIFYRSRELVQSVRDLEKLVRTDDLTGLANDRSFREVFTQRSSSLILFDLDQFKTYNDAFGHPAGDVILRNLGEILGQKLTCFRLGGDEFAVIVAGDDFQSPEVIAELLRRKIRDQPWPNRPITASFGIALADPQIEPATLRDRADKALYQAKREGGDRVCIFRAS